MTGTRSKSAVCVVVGVGPGNGAAFVRRFVDEGYAVAMIARSGEFIDGLAAEMPQARAYRCDAGDALQVEATFDKIALNLGAVDVVIYNAGKGVWGSAEEVSLEAFEAAWRTNTFGAFAVARCVIPAMKVKGAGHLFLIGATASRRGGARTAALRRPRRRRGASRNRWHACFGRAASMSRW